MVGHRNCGPVADLNLPQSVVDKIMFLIRAGSAKIWKRDP